MLGLSQQSAYKWGVRDSLPLAPLLTSEGKPCRLGGMKMERLALKILALLNDLHITNADLDNLGWQLVYQSNKPMRKRLVILADAILFHHYQETARENDGHSD
jgi:hypothetical protein